MNVRCVCGRDVEIPEGKSFALCPDCGQVVPPPHGAPLPPPPAGARAGGSSNTPRYVILLVLAMSACLILVCAGIFAAVFFPAFNHARQAGNRAACGVNVRSLGMTLAVYASENKDQYPPMPAIPGRLMFSKELFYPEYISDPSTFECPSQDLPKRLHPEDYVDDESYFYLSHALTNDDEGAAFVEAYRKRMSEGKPLEGDIPVAEGEGSAGKNELMALRTGIESLLAADPLDDAEKERLLASIPVIVEWPSHHFTPGGNVYYLDGHAEFMEYPGPFPMTREFIEAMQELDRLGAQ